MVASLELDSFSQKIYDAQLKAKHIRQENRTMRKAAHKK